MKTFLYIALLLFAFSSCSQPSGNVMQVNSTITVSSTDSKDSILLKAAHVVPTANQYEALKNEYLDSNQEKFISEWYEKIRNNYSITISKNFERR